ncbi:MAG TPA: hypothetical protein VN648_34260, partial [Candidatus Methylomirabilis sp.]|nr:hypothetical protein [Candidatus Methylomirabilis sp.]
ALISVLRGTTSHRTWHRSNRWLGQSGDDPRRDAGYAVLNQRSPDPVSGSLLYCYLLFESNIRGIRLLVAGALAFEVKGQAFVA